MSVVGYHPYQPSLVCSTDVSIPEESNEIKYDFNVSCWHKMNRLEDVKFEVETSRGTVYT